MIDDTSAKDENSAQPGPLDALFESMVADALDSLPDVFRQRLGRVAIVIEHEPSPELLASVGAPGLFGLYQGVPMTAYRADEVPVASKITIYRNSHLARYGDLESLSRGVADTVRHEIAHHFGISDARLEELARDRNETSGPRRDRPS